jgi:hypothetical protein
MPRFVYRPGHPDANEFGMVDASVAPPRNIGGNAPGVIRDEMEPTRHMADGRYYTSKSRFREATKAAGCREVGNEIPTLLKPRQPIKLDRQVRRDGIRKAIYELQNGINRR